MSCQASVRQCVDDFPHTSSEFQQSIFKIFTSSFHNNQLRNPPMIGSSTDIESPPTLHFAFCSSHFNFFNCHAKWTHTSYPKPDGYSSTFLTIR